MSRPMNTTQSWQKIKRLLEQYMGVALIPYVLTTFLRLRV